jgi:hypothetical protein
MGPGIGLASGPRGDLSAQPRRQLRRWPIRESRTGVEVGPRDELDPWARDGRGRTCDWRKVARVRFSDQSVSLKEEPGGTRHSLNREKEAEQSSGGLSSSTIGIVKGSSLTRLEEHHAVTCRS